MKNNIYSIKTNISDKDLMQMIQLDNQSYECESYKGTFNLCKQWLSKNNEIYTALVFEDRVVGYINFMPLEKKAYKDFLDGKLVDTDIQDQHIADFSPSNPYGLFTSVVVDKKHRNKEAIELLFKDFYKKINHYGIKKFVCTAVSSDGERVIKRFQKHAQVATDRENNKVFEVVL